MLYGSPGRKVLGCGLCFVLVFPGKTFFRWRELLRGRIAKQRQLPTMTGAPLHASRQSESAIHFERLQLPSVNRSDSGVNHQVSLKAGAGKSAMGSGVASPLLAKAREMGYADQPQTSVNDQLR